MDELNSLDRAALTSELFRCCASDNWVQRMLQEFPFEDVNNLVDASNRIWWGLRKDDWLQAFSAHPKIGDNEAVKQKVQSRPGSTSWEGEEQKGVNTATDRTKSELKDLNVAYEKKFGFIFLICATGKTADEMLNSLKQRINNSIDTEVNYCTTVLLSIIILLL